MFNDAAGLHELTVGLLGAAACLNVVLAFVLRGREHRWFVFPWLLAAGYAGIAVGCGVHAGWGGPLELASSVCVMVAAILMWRRARRHAKRRRIRGRPKPGRSH